MRSPERRTSGYRVRLSEREKARLEHLADQAGVTVADSLRIGAVAYLVQQLERQATHV